MEAPKDADPLGFLGSETPVLLSGTEPTHADLVLETSSTIGATL